MTLLSRASRALKDERIRRLTVDWSQVFANLCVAFSILVAVWVFTAQRQDQKAQLEAQLEAQKAQDRRSAAMQFVMLKHQESFLEPAARISAVFAEPHVIELLRHLRGEERREILVEQTSKAGLVNFETMADLYRAVIACREAGSCDRAVLDAAYRSEITKFYCLAREYALPELAGQLNDPEYGAPLAGYAGECRG